LTPSNSQKQPLKAWAAKFGLNRKKAGLGLKNLKKELLKEAKKTIKTRQ